PRGFDVRRGARQLELDALELGQRLAGLLALFRVLRRVLDRVDRQAEHLRPDADAAFVERLDRDLVPLADLAQHRGFRHAAVFEDELAGARRANAELVFLLADGESGHAALDEERGDAAI